MMLKEAEDTWRAGPAFQSYPGQAQQSGKTEDAATPQLPTSHPRASPDPSALTNLKRGKALDGNPGPANTSFKRYRKFFGRSEGGGKGLVTEAFGVC